MSTVVEGTREAPIRAARERLGPARRRLLYIAALIGLANLIVLIAQAHSLAHQLYTNADNASALVLPALAAHASAGAIVNLGNHPWYEPWWFMRATAGLPDYRQLWEVAPFVVALLGIASVAMCARWALGPAAGLLSAVVLLSNSDALRGVLYTPEARVVSVLHLGVLCGALLFAYQRARTGRLSRSTLFAVGVPLVLFSGPGFTDQLVVVMGLLPFVLAPLLCWLRIRSNEWRLVSLFAVVTGAASLLLAVLLDHLMAGEHIEHVPFPIVFVSSSGIVKGLQNVIAEFASLGGGSFFSSSVSGANIFVFVIGILTLAALAGILRSIWRWTTVFGETGAPSRDVRAGMRELFIAYWGIMLVAVLLTFALTSVSESAGNDRYLLGAWIAAAALLGAFATTPAMRTAIVLGVCLFGVLTLRTHLADGVPAYGQGPSQPTAYAVEHFVEANGAHFGYSGYWDAAPVTWETELRVRVYPIGACGSISRSGWCPFGGNMISSWYRPGVHARTFLITDDQPGDPIEVKVPPPAFGHPVAQQAFGPFTVYIYDHNLASNLGS